MYRKCQVASVSDYPAKALRQVLELGICQYRSSREVVDEHVILLRQNKQRKRR